EKAEMSQSAVSHQLAVLRHTNIVRQSRSGQTVTYSLADDHVALLLELALAHIREENQNVSIS
ncbi:MAG: helix-turn-helix transcriptional regulator, partial [Ruminococcus sp.]|nr:helix-turn-helix transcriptional regulator [Candidatus Apopatosoma intestinale]